MVPRLHASRLRPRPCEIAARRLAQMVLPLEPVEKTEPEQPPLIVP